MLTCWLIAWGQMTPRLHPDQGPHSYTRPRILASIQVAARAHEEMSAVTHARTDAHRSVVSTLAVEESVSSI